jgi:hypothetical protein
VSALAAKLARARAEAPVLDLSEGVGQVGSIGDAYRVQDALAATSGSVRAWKVSALVPEQQRGYPTDRAVGGPVVRAIRPQGTCARDAERLCCAADGMRDRVPAWTRPAGAHDSLRACGNC